MPIYEYACEHCGHHLEVMQKISEEPITQCPKCKQDTLVRLVSAAGFRLKGGGWYETDFKDTEKKKNLASGDSEANTSSTGSDAKNQTPAASHTESKTETPKGDTSISGPGTAAGSSSNTSSSSETSKDSTS